VTKSGDGTGNVSGTGINCGNNCTETANSGTDFALSQSASAGSVFSGWNGCDSVSNGVCNVNLTSDRTIDASFGLEQATLTVNKSGNGTGSVTGTGIACGNDCTHTTNSGTNIALSPVADSGSVFAGWTGCTSIANQICTVVLDSDTTAVATFNSSATLSVTKLGTGSGTVTSAPGNINCGAECFDTFSAGVTVTLTAVANGDSSFRSYIGCDSTNGNTCSVTLDTSKTVSVRFSPPITDADRTSVIQQIIQSLD
jgi:hypothetical protein